jgi:hypothetical protein
MNKSLQHALQLGACSLVLACTACKQGGTEAPTETNGLAEAALPMTESDDNAASTGEGLGQQVSAAVADLADSAGIATDAITVREARTVNWGSGAVGCPKEGMNYTQAIVPGVLLLLEADGKIYRYHGRSGGAPFYCPDDRAQAPAYGQGEEFM